MLRAAEIAIRRVREAEMWSRRDTRCADTYEQYDLSAESPSVRVKGRRSLTESVTDRTQQWTELQTCPLGVSGTSASHENDMEAFCKAFKSGKEIGAGGFGTVFMAINRDSGERVAVKRLSSREMTLGGIRTEVEVRRLPWLAELCPARSPRRQCPPPPLSFQAPTARIEPRRPAGRVPTTAVALRCCVRSSTRTSCVCSAAIGMRTPRR